MRAFWLVPTHYLLEDRRIADVIINIFFFLLLYFLKQIYSISGESVTEVVKISLVISAAACVSLFFLSHFESFATTKYYLKIHFNYQLYVHEMCDSVLLCLDDGKKRSCCE